MNGLITEDGKCQARWGKFFCIPTQGYDVSSGIVGRIFFEILFLQLNGLSNRNWNSKRVIVFQSVIL